ncbi:MAG TPA: GH25 family lysozyme [Candidatus Paceibacterota bacterium]
MTLFYNDLSSYDVGFKVPANAPCVVAKATEGNYYMDKQYHNFEQQAAALNIPFSGYHFLTHSTLYTPEAQAAWYYGFAGKTPCMLDVEKEGASTPNVDDCNRFIKALAALGGRVWAVYYPRWYWGITGGNLASLGVPVVASEYRSYDENRWPLPYGGITPLFWQFTSSPHDTNAFKGTPEQLAALIYGDNMVPSDVWGFRNQPLDNEDMRQYLVDASNNTKAILAALSALTAKVNALSVTTLDPKAVADAELAEIKAKL